MLGRLRRRGALGLVGLVLTLPAPAFAQASDPAAAEALFRRAREAKARGDDASACPLFAESQRLDPSVGTLMNVAECEEHAGQLAAAWESWHESLDQLLRARDSRADLARARVDALDERVPKLTIRLSPDAVGAHVARDGVDIGPAGLGVPLPVDPGLHALTVGLAGHELGRRSVTLAEGQSIDVLLEPGALAQSPESAPPEPVPALLPPPGDAARAWELSLGAAGVGLVAVVASAIVAAHERSVVDGQCGADKECSGTGLDAARAGKTWVTVNTVSSIFTVVAAGVGVALVLRSALGTTSVTPAGGPGHGGFVVTQAF